MSGLKPVVDHVVINVGDDLDNAAQVYTGLGFQLTPRGRHSLGTSNHLAIFGENYLELLGHPEAETGKQGNGWPARPGLSGLVWKTGGADADEIYRHLQRVGLAGSPPEAFYRPVTLPDGSEREARFRTVRLAPERINNGRSFFLPASHPGTGVARALAGASQRRDGYHRRYHCRPGAVGHRRPV
ncbi:VOC family protein [Acerihabitans sp. KWT182]|uniref:VOC family protein n=1 Tax=Acerihabitans sp. KWT182 TaxID=3157919 RepID=A0AAU7QDI6_9GAMM